MSNTNYSSKSRQKCKWTNCQLDNSHINILVHHQNYSIVGFSSLKSYFFNIKPASEFQVSTISNFFGLFSKPIRKTLEMVWSIQKGKRKKLGKKFWLGVLYCTLQCSCKLYSEMQPKNSKLLRGGVHEASKNSKLSFFRLEFVNFPLHYLRFKAFLTLLVYKVKNNFYSPTLKQYTHRDVHFVWMKGSSVMYTNDSYHQ